MPDSNRPSFVSFGFLYVAFLLVLIIFGFYYYQSYHDHYRDHAQQTLSSIADLKINDIIQWRHDRLQDAEFIQKQLNQSVVFSNLLKNPTNQQFQNEVLSFISRMQSIKQYDFFFLDRKGNSIFTFPKETPPISSITLQLIHKEEKTEKIIWIDLHKNDINQKIYMGYLIPSIHKNGSNEMSSFIFLRIDPAIYLYPLMQKWPNDNRTAETLLVRKEGENVLFLNELKFLNNSALSKTIPLTQINTPAVQAVLGRIGYFEGIDYRGEPVASELRPIPNSPWYMVARMDKSEIFATLYEKINQLILLLLAIAFLFALLLLWIRSNQRKIFNREQSIITIKNQEMEENIRLANEKANLYLSLVGSIIVVIEHNEKVSMINDAGCKLLGYTREEVLGKNWFDHFMPQSELQKVKEVFSKIIKGEMENVEYYENQIQTKTGESIDIAWHNSLLKDKEGNVFGTVSSGEDITDRKRAHNTIIKMNEELEEKVIQRTQELQNSNKELEAFAYSVSHDLRAPLRSIDGYSHMLLDEFSSKLDEEGIRILNVIRKSAHNMDRLIFDLLTMAKVARSEMKFDVINMKKLALSVYDELIDQDEQQKIEFSVGSLPPCYGDTTLIHQVWMNLIGNALKYSSKKLIRKIRIEGAVDQENFVYSISDNGVGFNQAYVGKLFGAFQRLHSSQEFEGTGIGLAIVDRIINRHGGAVWAEGDENVGATFYFSLPKQSIDPMKK